MSKQMSAVKVANPYAEALFQLGLSLYVKNQDPEPLYNLVFDMQDLLLLLSEVPEAKAFLEDPLGSPAAKKDFLLSFEEGLQRKFNVHTMNFLCLLVDKKRIGLVDNIGKKFLQKAYEFFCIKFVDVSSTVELSPKQQKALIAKIDGMLGPVFTEPYLQSPNIQLNLHIDKTILGGLVIKLDSKVIDLSLLGELRRLGKELNVTL